MIATQSLQMSQASARALMQKVNERTAVYFVVSITGLFFILAAMQAANVVLVTSNLNSRRMLVRNIIKKARLVRSALLRKIQPFPSLGHALVFAVYIIINITLLLHDLGLSVLRNWAKRMGWITTCNIALITFLALKNTPLAFLTAYSYERLNILHQAAGYCTVFFAILHAVLYIATDAKLVMGIVAGFAMLSMLTTALILRRIRYEVFYIIHIVMFMLIIIAVGMHRSKFQTKSIYIIIFSASFWASDRLLRGLRIVLHAFGNRANVYPLSRGGIRLVMRRTPWRAVPGTHVFLWIPKVRAIETHPFTIVSTNSLEVAISSRDGFTRDLFSLASQKPGALLRASCDGPYGTLPNFAKFEHVVLVAGGSGATFTIGVALDLTHRLSPSRAKPVIHFIWFIRDYEMKEWFEKELAEMSSSPMVKLTVFVTRTPNVNTPGNEQQSTEQALMKESSFEKSKVDSDPEKAASGSCSPTPRESNSPVLVGHPDISAVIHHIVSATEENERTIVAACGPESLMGETRCVVANLVATSRRSVTLHCEQFGW
ncbi:hypothetical protein N431DRAFT_547515 [Stipitochalara longipes BDJ]|nr:hypothetical protein N431DRAFT_547515 [Stipitochalara longipes BDJ]